MVGSSPNGANSVFTLTSVLAEGREELISRSFNTLPQMRLLQHSALAESYANWSSELAESLRDACVLVICK